MRTNRRNHAAFRPDLNRNGLEERLVLSLPPGFNFVSPEQASRFRAAVSREVRSTEFAVRTQIQAQARQLFANGTPTTQQMADFEADADGTILAGTSAVASTFALVPGAQRSLVPSTARALLGNSQSSLMSRVHNLVTNGLADQLTSAHSRRPSSKTYAARSETSAPGCADPRK